MKELIEEMATAITILSFFYVLYQVLVYQAFFVSKLGLAFFIPVVPVFISMAPFGIVFSLISLVVEIVSWQHQRNGSLKQKTI